MAIIAMTREMGTLGKDVAREFAQRMRQSVLHHELVESSAERNRREQESEVYRFLEGSEDEIDGWRGDHAKGGYMTAAEILEVALEGNVIIRGWGAARLMKSVPHVLSVRVCAPMEFRIEQIMSRLGIDERSARREIERNDASHSRTLLRFFEADWRDSTNYDLVLNTAHLSPKVCSDILVDAVSNPAFQETEETRRVLNDRLLEARVATALAEHSELVRNGGQVHVAVADAEVRLYGVVADGRCRRLAEDVVASLPGVHNLRNEIVRARGFYG